MNIGNIIWPNDNQTALNHYLNFLIEALNNEDIVFPDVTENPIAITKAYLSRQISDNQRKEANRAWWSYLENNDLFRNFSKKEAVAGRIAICLLSSTPENKATLGDSLSWFLEMLWSYGVDTTKTLEKMREYFDFDKP